MKKIICALTFLIGFKALAVEEIITISEPIFNPTLTNRFALMAGLNPSMKKAADIANFSFSYAQKMENYWLDSNLVVTRGKFTQLTTNNLAATQTSDDQLLDSNSTHVSIGAGLARETRYIETLVPIQNMYELTAADLTYNIFKESTSGKSFTGPGIMAKFSLYKRFSDFFSVGGQFLYNLAVVKRSQDFDEETSSARSLTVSYLTMGIDLSFYL